MDLIETQVLRALADAGIPLDATQVAERASLTPSDAGHALAGLCRKDLAVRLPSRRRDRLTKYMAVN